MKTKTNKHNPKNMDQSTHSAHKTTMKKRSAVKSTTLSQRMKTLRGKVKGINGDQYTDYLVDMTLNRLEILLKHLYTLSARHGKDHVVTDTPVKRKQSIRKSDAVDVVEDSSPKENNTQSMDKTESDVKSPLIKYRWIAEVREGAPGFADDDSCTSFWFNTREAAEEDMNNNAVKHCKEEFPHLRRIIRVYIEEKHSD